MQVIMSCSTITKQHPVCFWRRAGRWSEDIITPQLKVKEFFLFKHLKVIISHFQSRPWFLTFTSASSDSFFFFFLKPCGNFSSDVTGNRELFQWQQILVFQYCITAARSWLLARDHDKWLEAPRGKWSPPVLPKVLPQPSPMSPKSWDRLRPDVLDSWHQDGKMYCC